jgi:hypothetical protein
VVVYGVDIAYPTCHVWDLENFALPYFLVISVIGIKIG